jgi:hypothetical protein
MALSSKTIKNLLDLMQKLSLAIVVVSIGLFSNVVLSHSSIERKAGDELAQLLRIRDQIANDSAVDVVHRRLPSEFAWFKEDANQHVFVPFHLKLKIGHDPTFLEDVTVGIPDVLYNTDFSDLDRKSFNQIQTLQEMRKVWDTIYSTTSYSDKPKITGVGLSLPSIGKQYRLQWEEEEDKQEEDSDTWALSLRESEKRYSTPLGVELYFEIGPEMEKADLNGLTQALKLPVADRNLLTKQAELIVDTSWRRNNFSPADSFGPALAKKRNFAEAFPNLDRLPDNYQEQRLNSLRTSLEKATQNGKEEIEALGAKIPSDLFPLFGLPVLAILLFQLSAVAFYVRNNIEQLEVEEASQWSFLLNGWPFVILSIGTIFVLPTAASVLSFVYVRGESLLPRPVNLAFATIVVVFSVRAIICLLKLQALTKMQNTQDDLKTLAPEIEAGELKLDSGEPPESQD